METGETVLVVGGIAVAVYLIARNTTTAAPPIAPPVAPATGGGGNAFNNDFVNKVVTGSGAVAGAVGTAVGSAYLGPLGKLVGAQAAADTKYNLLETTQTFATVGADIAHGNVAGAASAAATGVVKTAVQPLKTTYNILKSLNPF